MVAKKATEAETKSTTSLEMPVPSGVADVLTKYADVFKPVLTGVNADNDFIILADNASASAKNPMKTEMERLTSEIEAQRTAARSKAETYTPFDQYVSPTTGVSGFQIILGSSVAGDSPEVTVEKVTVEESKTFEKRNDGGFLGTGRGRSIFKLFDSSYAGVSQEIVSPTDATRIAKLEKDGYKPVSTTKRETETEKVKLSDLLQNAAAYLDGVQKGTIAVVSEDATSKAVAEWLANNTADALKKAGEEAAKAVSARGLEALASLEGLGRIQGKDVTSRTNDAAEARRRAAYDEFDVAVKSEKEKYQAAEKVLRESGEKMKALFNQQTFLSRALDGAKGKYDATKEGDSLNKALVSYLETVGMPILGATFNSYQKELETTEATIKELSSAIIDAAEHVRQGKPHMDAIDAIYRKLEGAYASDERVKASRLERLQTLQAYSVKPGSDSGLTSYVSSLKRGK